MTPGNKESVLSTQTPHPDDTMRKSALQDNIESKGKNSYYFAHAHKATGPKWDGKVEPRLLVSTNQTNHSTNSSEINDHLEKSINLVDQLHLHQVKRNSFDFRNNTITKYSFLNEGMKIKVYIELIDVGKKCTNEDISFDWTESSFVLQVKNFNQRGEGDGDGDDDDGGDNCGGDGVECLSLNLYGKVENANYKKKKDRIIIVLDKMPEENGDKEWPTLSS